MMSNILLIEDDIELSQMLSEYLTNEGFNVKCVCLGQDGINEALSGHHRAVILDAMLPDINGIDVLKSIRHKSNVPIIMLTAKGDNIDRILGLELGADDYIPKPCYPRELLARLRAVLRRVEEIPPAVEDHKKYEWNELTLDIPQRLCTWLGHVVDLTSTEFNLLILLIKYHDRVVTKEELSEEGLGRSRELYDRSVDVHISNIRQKLNHTAKNLPESTLPVTIETIRAIGYRIR